MRKNAGNIAKNKWATDCAMTRGDADDVAGALSTRLEAAAQGAELLREQVRIEQGIGHLGLQ